MDTLDIIRRMCLVPLPDETDPSEFYGTYKNPYCFWNMMAIWRRDDGAIMRSRFGMTAVSGMPGEYNGPFSDGIRAGTNKFLLSSGSEDIYETFIYINAAGNRVYARTHRVYALAGRGYTFYRVLRDASDSLISMEVVGTAVAATGAVSGYEILDGWNILGQIVEVRRNITSINTAGTIVRAAANVPDIVSIANLGDIQTQTFQAAPSYRSFVSLSFINGVTTTYSSLGINNILSFYNGNSSGYSIDKRIRLLGREMTTDEISASTVIVYPDGSLGIAS